LRARWLIVRLRALLRYGYRTFTVARLVLPDYAVLFTVLVLRAVHVTHTLVDFHGYGLDTPHARFWVTTRFAARLRSHARTTHTRFTLRTLLRVTGLHTRSYTALLVLVTRFAGYRLPHRGYARLRFTRTSLVRSLVATHRVLLHTVHTATALRFTHTRLHTRGSLQFDRLHTRLRLPVARGSCGSHARTHSGLHTVAHTPPGSLPRLHTPRFRLLGLHRTLVTFLLDSAHLRFHAHLHCWWFLVPHGSAVTAFLIAHTFTPITDGSALFYTRFTVCGSHQVPTRYVYSCVLRSFTHTGAWMPRLRYVTLHVYVWLPHGYTLIYVRYVYTVLHTLPWFYHGYVLPRLVTFTLHTCAGSAHGSLRCRLVYATAHGSDFTTLHTTRVGLPVHTHHLPRYGCVTRFPAVRVVIRSPDAFTLPPHCVLRLRSDCVYCVCTPFTHIHVLRVTLVAGYVTDSVTTIRSAVTLTFARLVTRHTTRSRSHTVHRLHARRSACVYAPHLRTLCRITHAHTVGSTVLHGYVPDFAHLAF